MDNNTIGRDALGFIDSLLSPDEIAESNSKVAQIGKFVNMGDSVKKSSSTGEG